VKFVLVFSSVMFYKQYHYQEMHSFVFMYFTINLLLHVSALVVLTELTSVMLKRTAVKYFYNIHAYQMCRFLLKFTAFEMLV